MATREDNLSLSLDQCAANLAFITSKPRPEYVIEGATYSWQRLFEIYTAQMKEVRRLWLRQQGPFIGKSRGVS